MAHYWESCIAVSHKLGRRVAALAFIGLILIGNLWLIHRFTGEVSPRWSTTLFYFLSGLAGLGALMMVPHWIKPSKVSGQTNLD
jgi:hypothetical protein